VTSAREQADAAARDCGVDIRSANRLADYAQICRLLDDTWGRGAGADPSFVQAIAHAGNTVLLAERDGATVGVLVGVLGWDAGLHVHSHVAAVTPAARGGVGFALKLAQRALALDHGVQEVRWTFDPLIRRNAHLNLEKLGATVRAYLPDFYGRLDDAISGADRSDRFEVSWHLDSAEVDEAVSRSLARSSSRGAGAKAPAADQITRAEPAAHDHGIRFELHPDFEALRRTDPDAAAEFREASRAVFAPAFEEGLSVGFVHGGYVFA
jgi:predicted GNAT superfamily acetyltransferase